MISILSQPTNSIVKERRGFHNHNQLLPNNMAATSSGFHQTYQTRTNCIHRTPSNGGSEDALHCVCSRPRQQLKYNTRSASASEEDNNKIRIPSYIPSYIRIIENNQRRVYNVFGGRQVTRPKERPQYKSFYSANGGERHPVRLRHPIVARLKAEESDDVFEPLEEGKNTL